MGMVSPPGFDILPDFYSSSINVGITNTMAGAVIRYTRDGSEPTESSTAYCGPISFTATGIIRTRAFKPGWIPSRTITRTYFINESDVVRNVPVVSIVGNAQRTLFKSNGVTAINGGAWIDNIWQAQTADDYNIPQQRGRPYERPASIMFFDDSSHVWKEIDCGIRIAGSNYTRKRYYLQDLTGFWDLHTNIKKPQFNLYFRSDYGEGTLDFPFIANSDVQKFDSIRLRSGKNDWKNPFIIDEFVRRISINMGHVSSKGYLAWLFVNGERKAYFNPVERLDERFFQEWYDSNEEWDIINHGGVSEGDNLAWKDTLSFLDNYDLRFLANYIYATQKVDVVNYIDYLIAETYGGNWDWPNNNWYVARERRSNSLFRFYVWDAEGCFFGRNTIDVDSFNENPIYATDGGSGLNGEDGAVARVYQAFKESEEFRLLFADRIQKHYFDDGAMVESNLIEEWTALENVFFPMLQSFFGLAMDVRTRTQWIPQRRPYVFQQFKNEGLWPDTTAPYFNQHGGAITSGFHLYISHTNGIGNIYYTCDKTDPRNIGGSIHGTEYITPLALDRSTHVKARVYNSTLDEWSPLREATFVVTGIPNFVVTEMMYHPISGEEYEFIELKNVSGAELDISGYSFVDGITYSFVNSSVTTLQPDEYIVVVQNEAAFASLYATNTIHIAGVYEGKQKNSGERIELQDSAGHTHLAYTYSDVWYPITDGGGKSLVIADEYGVTNMWGVKEGWLASDIYNGTPGTRGVPEPHIYMIFVSIYVLLLVRKDRL